MFLSKYDYSSTRCLQCPKSKDHIQNLEKKYYDRDLGIISSNDLYKFAKLFI